VGDGSIFFWHHKGCDGVLLNDCFPSLYALGEDRAGRVFNYLEHNCSLVVWSFIFVRDAFPQGDSVGMA